MNDKKNAKNPNKTVENEAEKLCFVYKTRDNTCNLFSLIIVQLLIVVFSNIHSHIMKSEILN